MAAAVSAPFQSFLDALGSVHGAVHGNGKDVLERLVTNGAQMLRDRGCSHVQVASNVEERVKSGAWVVRANEVRIFVSMEERVGIKYARSILDGEDAAEGGVVIVSLEGPTPYTRRECASIQFMSVRDLCVNKSRHVLVPRHERVEKAPVETEHMPRILENDPIVQYYGWPVGSVIRITRVFGGYEPRDYFRVVVPATSN